MSRFKIDRTPLEGLLLVQRTLLSDERGYFARMFCSRDLAEAGLTAPLAQVNHSRTTVRGCVRGLHFQRPPHSETKLVSCLRGAVLDVAVDVRVGSPTYLQWHGALLSADNGHALLVPPGFAHGFQALSNDVEMLYCNSAPHVGQAEDGLNPLDEQLAIAWPLPVVAMSPRDAARPRVAAGFVGVAA